MVGGHFTFHGEFAAARLDEASDLQILFVDLVVDLVLLRTGRQEIHWRQKVDANSRVALRGPRSAVRGPRDPRLRTGREEQWVLEIVDWRLSRRRVQREWVLLFLL